MPDTQKTIGDDLQSLKIAKATAKASADAAIAADKKAAADAQRPWT